MTNLLNRLSAAWNAFKNHPNSVDSVKDEWVFDGARRLLYGNEPKVMKRERDCSIYVDYKNKKVKVLVSGLEYPVYMDYEAYMTDKKTFVILKQ